MLYYVQRGDTLVGIASRFGTTLQAILNANLICNPNIILSGEALIIPQPGLDLPRAGASPYYIVRPGDTLYCIAQQLGTSVRNLAEANQISDPNLIYPGTELLVVSPTTEDPEQLKLDWERTPGEDCEVFGFTEYGTYYLGSFEWAAFGRRAVPYLLQLLGNPCDIVRYYAVTSLGRLAINGEVTRALNNLLGDPAVTDIARLALRRIQLAGMGRKRVHVTIRDYVLLSEPRQGSASTPLPAGSEIRVLKWFIPSPTGEEGPRGGLQIYDQIQVVGTGQVGFLERLGYNQIILI